MSFFNGFDYVILAIFLLSVFFAVINGFVKTFLSLFGWVASTLLATLASPYAVGFFKNFIHNEMLANFVTVLCLFVILVIAFALLNSLILSLLASWRGGFLDKSLGLLFGLIRATFVGVIIFISATLLYPIFNPKSSFAEDDGKPAQHVPTWLLEAQSYNILKTSSDMFLLLIPNNILEEYHLDNINSTKSHDQFAILQKLVKILPYGDSYSEELAQYETGKNYTRAEKRDLTIKMLDDYNAALNSNLISIDQKLSAEDLRVLRKATKK